MVDIDDMSIESIKKHLTRLEEDKKEPEYEYQIGNGDWRSIHVLYERPPKCDWHELFSNKNRQTRWVIKDCVGDWILIREVEE